MIILDSIIYSLQSGGGITVYFNQLKERLASGEFEIVNLVNNNDRALERYRSCRTFSHVGVFHSSYYRLPSNRTLRTITTVHDFTYEKFIKGPAKWVHCWQKYHAIRNSDLVICVSQNTANDLMYYCPIEPTKIRVIYNGVSETYSPLVAKGALTNEILFVGARAGYKNFNLAIKTLSKLPDFTLSIVGGGELLKAETEMLEHYIPGRYQWLGRLSDEELNLAYNRAYALLYPSSYEGFGIPIVEAMRAGCPVVAVRVSSIPEVAGNAAILTESADADLFAEALSGVCTKREILRIAGFEQAAKFSWDKCFAETLQVYKELM